VQLAFPVPRRAFLPPPRVESAVVEIRWRAVPRVPIDDEAAYRAVVRAAFGQRRKMLRNALRTLAAARGLDGHGLEAALARAGVAPTARAETLALDDFARLARALDA
jgi:16S rRNA (adenine1518-N6/adenine1519-N6)-dimethyltransferase